MTYRTRCEGRRVRTRKAARKRFWAEVDDWMNTKRRSGEAQIHRDGPGIITVKIKTYPVTS